MALLALAEDSRSQREARLEYAETQLRRLCAERGLDWDAMSEEEREAFMDDLVHEGRQCSGQWRGCAAYFKTWAS